MAGGRRTDYAIVIARAADGSYSAYVPAIPGCVACGDTSDEARTLIVGAVRPHFESRYEHGESVAAPAAVTGVIRAA